MTEQEWLTSTDPLAMLTFATHGEHNNRWHHKGMSDRKLRLFAEEAGCQKCAYLYCAPLYRDDSAADYAEYVALAACRTSAEKAAMLRDILGNPFRPVVAVLNQKYFEKVPDDLRKRVVDLRDVMVWHDALIPTIARAIYDELRFEEMPILADALEEAGCTDEEILRHCRRPLDCQACDNTGVGMDEYTGTVEIIGGCPRCKGDAGPHVRGCWVLDLLLGNE